MLAKKMKLLVNQYERITYDRLLEACHHEGAQVCPKVRIKDAIPIENSGVTDGQYRYALQSHFDFVVTDRETNALFAVEFDGESHRTPDAERRDRLKNDLCSRFELPLLRVNANHLTKKFRQWDLLTYFVDTWFLKRAFEEAQERGTIPLEEDFDPMFVISDGKEGRWPYWFSAPSQIAIQQLHKRGRILHDSPSYLNGYDADGNMHHLAYIRVSETAWVSSRTGMRSQLFDVCTSDVLGQIGLIGLHERLEQVLAGHQPMVDASTLDAQVEQFVSSYTLGSYGGVVEAPLDRVHKGRI